MNEPFWGYDPVGDYAIHILVNNRVVTLAGVVDSEGDKTLAGLKTRGVTGVSELNNDLQVGKPHTRPALTERSESKGNSR